MQGGQESGGGGAARLLYRRRFKIAFLSATQIERVDNPDTKGATETLPVYSGAGDVDMLLQAVTEAKSKQRFCGCLHSLGNGKHHRAGLGAKEQAP